MEREAHGHDSLFLTGTSKTRCGLSVGALVVSFGPPWGRLQLQAMRERGHVDGICPTCWPEPVEPKDHKCPCCENTVTKTEYYRVVGAIARAQAVIAAGGVWCRQCGGPVEDDRKCYDRPTCHACLPPPAPLKLVFARDTEVAPILVTGQFTATRLLDPGVCHLPPDGWTCSREPGHDGPCAARPKE